MSIKNNKMKIISKLTTVVLLSGCIYFTPKVEEVYADKNESSITQSYTQNNIKKGKIKHCDFLNVRKGPNTKYSVVTKVYTNSIVEILEISSNGWYKIKTQSGVVGWASGKYIEIEVSNSSQKPDNDQIADKRKQVVDLAYKQIGKPYKWGAGGPSSFDCSGLTSYVYKNATNISLPRVSKEQAKVGKTISKENLQPGDLVFFKTNGKSISHVGIYIGDSKMIHAPSSGKNVKIDSINSLYYQRTYATSKSIL